MENLFIDIPKAPDFCAGGGLKTEPNGENDSPTNKEEKNPDFSSTKNVRFCQEIKVFSQKF